jgi:hypothetical protein
MSVKYNPVGWYYRMSTQRLIKKKYIAYGYVSLEILAEWQRLIPKKETAMFPLRCKKEYNIIDRME